MHRTDSPGSVAGRFVTPDVETGVPGTDDGIDWRNDLQENVAVAVERSGQTLVKGTDDAPAGYSQLADAVNILTGRVLTAAKKNLFLNPGFDLWQASFNTPPSMAFDSTSNPAGYTADQWYAYVGNIGVTGSATVSLAQLNPGLGNAPHGTRSELVFAASIGSSPSPAALGQRMELLEEVDASTLTLSVVGKVDAGTMLVTPYCRQVFGSGGSADVVTTYATFTLTTTRTRFAAVCAVPSVVGKTVGSGAYTEFGWIFSGGGAFTARLSAAQLEFGTVATDWAMPDLTLDLQACQRYFWKSWDPSTEVGHVTEVGACTSDEARTIMAGLNIKFAVPMRTVPALTWYSPYTGTAGKISRPIGTDADVTAIQFTSRRQSGTPTTGAVSSGFAVAHLTADARL